MKDYKNCTERNEETPLEAVAAFIGFIGSMVALYIVLVMVSVGSAS